MLMLIGGIGILVVFALVLIAYGYYSQNIQPRGETVFSVGDRDYDYAYLDCARRRRLPLATLDRTLIRACAAVGVECLADARIAEPSATYRRSAAAARPKRKVPRPEPRSSRSA